MDKECADCRFSLACLSGALLRDSDVPAYYCMFCDETFGMSLQRTPAELSQGYEQIYEVRWHVRCEPRIRGVHQRGLINFSRVHRDMRPVRIADPSDLTQEGMWLHWCRRCFARHAYKLSGYDVIKEREHRRIEEEFRQRSLALHAPDVFQALYGKQGLKR